MPLLMGNEPTTHDIEQPGISIFLYLARRERLFRLESNKEKKRMFCSFISAFDCRGSGR